VDGSSSRPSALMFESGVLPWSGEEAAKLGAQIRAALEP
jgi:hypothetical protein